MAQNQYLPWAISGSANVYPYATYASKGEVLTGVVDGEGDPTLANTTWRQSSVIAAAWAQVVNDTTGIDMLDDGNVANVVSKFKTMLASVLVTSVPPLYYGQDSSNVPNTVTATVMPAMQSPTAGGIYVIRNNNTNTGPMQMTLGGGQTYPCVKGQGAAMAGGECFSGDWTVWTFTGAAYQLVNDKTVSNSITFSPTTVQQLQQIIVATSTMDIASNAILTIQLPAGVFNLTSITGALAFAHASGLQIRLVGAPLKTTFPTATQIGTKSNADTLTFLQTVFATQITSVGVNALEIRGALGSVQNILFTGDATASGGHYGALVGNWSTSSPSTGVTQFINCWFHGFGLDNVRAEQGGFIQGNNLGSTYSTAHCYHISHDSSVEVNVGNILAMRGTQGVAIQNQGLFAVDSASGTVDLSYNSVAGINGLGDATVNMNPATGVRIQNNGTGIVANFLCNIALSSSGSTTFSGNGQDINVANVSNVLTFGASLPNGSSPARGSTGNNGATVY